MPEKDLQSVLGDVRRDKGKGWLKQGTSSEGLATDSNLVHPVPN